MKRVKFPVLLSLQGSISDYLHAVVIWQNQIIDFQNVSRIKLTLKNLERCLGPNTRNISVKHGFGLIPSRATKKKMRNEHNVKEMFDMSCAKYMFFGV